MRNTYKLFILAVAALLLLASPSLATDLKNLDPQETREVIQNVEELIILDIRRPDEVRTGHIEGARNIDFYDRDFQRRLDSLDKETPYLIYCRTGRRSGVTIEYMQTAGFKRIYHLQKGIVSWVQAGLPLAR